MRTLLTYALFTFALATLHSVDAQQLTAKEELYTFLPPSISKSNFTLEDAKNLLLKKCEKNINSGNLTAEIQYENIIHAAYTLKSCGDNFPNMTAFMSEMDEARPTGDLDVVFKKYCNKLPHLQQCLQAYNDQWVLCLSPDERLDNAVAMKIVATLLEFLCRENGAYMAIFIAEEGPECIESNKDNIANCMNATFASYIPAAMPPTELPELVMTPQHCIDLHDFELCVLSCMETCNEATPAAIVEALFRYVRNETKCQEEIDKVIGIRAFNGQQRNVATGNGGKLIWLIFLYCALSCMLMMRNLIALM